MKTTKKQIEEKVIKSASCSFCKNKFDKTTVQCWGFGQLIISFGYGSDFDGDSFRLEICDKCFIERFGLVLEKQFRKKGYSMKELLSAFPTLHEQMIEKIVNKKNKRKTKK